jgi:putative endonuclease
MHYLYILYSSSIDKYYVGETADFEERLQQHNNGFYKGSYTKRASDWEKVLLLEFDTINQAKRAEIFVKKMNSRKFIERLFEDSDWLVEKFKI